MVREFSEEKRQEIFRLLDEIDNREWKSFMEWCGSSAEEFGDWPDKLAVNAYTRYVDKYHERVLEINEMTRNRVNTVFENVAEIDTRYAGRMKDCQTKIKEQIAMVKTMTEFMQSMTDGKPDMALLNKGSVNESIRTEEEVDLTATSSDDAENEPSIYFLNDYFDSGEEFDRKEIIQILDGARKSGDITQDEYDYMNELFTEMYDLKDEISEYEKIINIYDQITERNQNKQYNNATNIYLLNDFLYSGEEFEWKEIERILEEAQKSGDITQEEYDNLIELLPKLHNIKQILTDEIIIQSLYEELEIEYHRITRRIRIQNGKNETNIYFLNDYFDSGEEFDREEILWILEGALSSGDITQDEYDYMNELFTEMYDLKDETSEYEEIINIYDQITERNQNKQYNNATNIYLLNDYLYSGEEFDWIEIIRILEEARKSGDITQDEYNNLKILLPKLHNVKQILTDEIIIQSLYEELEIEYNRITRKIQNGENETNIYFLNDYFDSGEEFSKDAILWILDGALSSGDITREEYYNMIASFTEMFDSTDEERIQTLYVEIKDEYERIAERNQYIQMYINEDFLRNIGFDFEKLGIDNFVVELKRGMIQYNITDEESIQMFLANCLEETGGVSLLEGRNDAGDAGSGLIQVTGDTQNQFLEMIQSRYDSDSEEYKLIAAIRSGYTYGYDGNGNRIYKGYNQPTGVNISPKDYIADNYPVESAVWYWGGYSEKCIVYTDARDRDQGCVTCTINEYVELYQSSCAGREEDLFIATQYYVNSAKLRAPYLQQLCEGYCDQNQNRYCITYFSNGNIVDVAKIEEAAQNNDDTIISQLRINKVEYQNQNPDAPNGCVARFWYYYRILALREEMEVQ